MIKLSMMARETPAAPIAATVAQAAALGLDGIDIHLGGMDRSRERVTRLRWDCLRRGLMIGYAGGGSLVGPVAEREQRLAQGRADVDTAVLLGAQLLRVFARHRWPETVAEQERLWAPMIASFQELADYAAERGLALGLQNHDESSFCMTAVQALRILREVDRPNLGFLLDTGQWQGAIGSDPRGQFDPAVDLYEDYLRPMLPHTVGVRAKIYKIDGGREAWLDYGRIAAMLREVGFNGTVGLVFELGSRNAASPEACARLAVAHLRQVLRQTG